METVQTEITTPEQFLQACYVQDNLVIVPQERVDATIYAEAKKRLEKAGGKWKGNKWGFQFISDPTELLQSLQNGQVRNFKKETQFFETPPALALRMAGMLRLDKPHLRILEPSAGHGALIKAAHQVAAGLQCCVYWYELNEANAAICNRITEKCGPTMHMGANFLDANPAAIQYDRIIANPPFSNNQDIDHIYHMHRFLKPKGILVSVCSMHPWISSNRKEKEFCQWLEGTKGCKVEDLPPETFKDSCTNVAAKLITIRN